MANAARLHHCVYADFESRASLVSVNMRDIVRSHIHKIEIPSLADVQLIIEVMGFAKGIVFNMLARVGSTKIAGKLEREEYEKIGRYAKEKGWANLVIADEKIRGKMVQARRARKDSAKQGRKDIVKGNGRQGRGGTKEDKGFVRKKDGSDFPALESK